MMEKRIRDRLKRIEKLETELLSDEEILAEKKEIQVLIDAIHQELLRRIIVMAAIIVGLTICVVGILANPTPLNLITVLISILLLIISIIQYYQKFHILGDLFKAADKLNVD